jgi:hypothetical protein
MNEALKSGVDAASACAVGSGVAYRLTAALIVATTLAGCASHTGVLPDGLGGYTISKQAATGFPGLGTLKGDIMQEANQYCLSQGRDFLLTNSTETQPPYLLGNYPRAEISFRCVAMTGAPTR